jgi:uncharacterized membrane protein (UPF0127 family)
MPDCYTVHNLNRQNVVAGQIHIAGTSAQRREGLLAIDQLEDGGGLWIAPCEAIHTFGMKLPIDVVFLDRDLHVTKLVPLLGPNRLSFSISAHSVLELKAGAIERSAIGVGDRLRFTPVEGH